MPVLFVSHASRDDTHATSLVQWLAAKGFDDVFVDHGKIAGGDKWADVLRSSAGACRVVICLVSPAWLASDECFAEFRAAWYMGKRIVPLYLLPAGSSLEEAATKRLASIRAEDQGLDIVPCLGLDGALDLDHDARVAGLLEAGLKAAGASSRVGLDPEAFAIDKSHRPTPFPGLASFGDDDADAALRSQPRDRRDDGVVAPDSSDGREATAVHPGGVGCGQVVAAQGRHRPALEARAAGVAAGARVSAGRRAIAQLRRGHRTHRRRFRQAAGARTHSR